MDTPAHPPVRSVGEMRGRKREGKDSSWVADDLILNERMDLDGFSDRCDRPVMFGCPNVAALMSGTAFACLLLHSELIFAK